MVPKLDTSHQFCAIGQIEGCFQPEADSNPNGTLITLDGCEFLATLKLPVRSWIQHHPEQLTQRQIWTCYPQTLLKSSTLLFSLIGIWQQQNATEIKQAKPAINQFNIRGVVIQQDNQAKTILVQVRRNLRPPLGMERAIHWQPFTLWIQGHLYRKAINQMWDFKCRRQGTCLVVEQAHFIQTMQPLHLSRRQRRK